jgi:hypothetical protein
MAYRIEIEYADSDDRYFDLHLTDNRGSDRLIQDFLEDEVHQIRQAGGRICGGWAGAHYGVDPHPPDERISRIPVKLKTSGVVLPV